MQTTKTRGSRLLCLLLAALMALSLAACGNNDGASGSQNSSAPSSTPAALTEDEYIAEIDALNDASTEVATTTSEAISDLASGDPDAMQAGVDKIRAIIPPFEEFAAIDNPPAEYAEAHAKLSEGCQVFSDAMNAFCDDLDALVAGEDVDVEAATTEYTNQLTEAGNLLAEGLDLANAVYGG